MTRKDFEIIADLLYNNKQKGTFYHYNKNENTISAINSGVCFIDDITNAFIDVLSKENPRFNKEIFIDRVNKGPSILNVYGK